MNENSNQNIVKTQKGFQPGHIGNPNGRGREKESLSYFIRDLTHNGRDIVLKVLAILKRPSSQRIAIQAAEFLRDTAYGRPAQAIEHSISAGKKMVMLPATAIIETTAKDVSSNGKDSDKAL